MVVSLSTSFTLTRRFESKSTFLVLVQKSNKIARQDRPQSPGSTPGLNREGPESF
jgi:hypothetical protein